MDDRFGVNPRYLAGVFASKNQYQHAHREGKGKGQEGREGDDGDLVQVDQKGLRWREDGCNSVMDPLSPSVFDLHPFAKSFSFRAVRT